MDETDKQVGWWLFGAFVICVIAYSVAGNPAIIACAGGIIFLSFVYMFGRSC